MTEPVRLFVYGTLLTVAEHPMGNLLRAHSRFLGRGSIQARLYIIDDPEDPGQNFYPGALPSGYGEDRVYGELYELSDSHTVLDAFDDYEACSADWQEPHEFQRRAVPVTMEDGDVLWATSYLYAWEVSRAQPVPSGRYTQVSPDVR